VRLTYTNVTATIALFVALGGTSYAAATISGRDIRTGTVTGSDLRNESVTGRDIDNSTLAGGDFRNASVTSSDVDDESLRAADVGAGAAPAGPPGLRGPAGSAQSTIRRTNEIALTLGATEAAVATCAPGEVAVGGGAGHDAAPTDFVTVLSDEPLAADGSPPSDGERATKWRAIGNNAVFGGLPLAHMRVYVLCAQGS
jgi:hypothetical protein